MLYNWVTFDLKYIREMKEANYTDYFDLDLVKCDDEDIDRSLMSTCNKITDQDTGKRIEMVWLDDDIREKVTLIKIDIEGAEQDALLGSVKHIQEDHPTLLISVYHNNEDIWKIPRMIIDMDPDYQLYLRSNGAQWGPAEIVLLAVDKQQKKRP